MAVAMHHGRRALRRQCSPPRDRSRATAPATGTAWPALADCALSASCPGGDPDTLSAGFSPIEKVSVVLRVAQIPFKQGWNPDNQAMKQDVRLMGLSALHLGNYFQHWRPIEINRATRFPFAPVLQEIELHEMASHRGEDHVTGLPIDVVREEEERIVC